MVRKSLLYEIEGLREHVENPALHTEKANADWAKLLSGHDAWFDAAVHRLYGKHGISVGTTTLRKIRAGVRGKLTRLLSDPPSFKLFVIGAHARRDQAIRLALKARLRKGGLGR